MKRILSTIRSSDEHRREVAPPAIALELGFMLHEKLI